MNKVEKEYNTRLAKKKIQQSAFRRFMRGLATPIKIREYVGMNFLEVRILLESRMLDTMSWANYGTHWVVDHVVPFWLFDLNDDKELKLLWHPDNLMPMIWKDNNHKQGDLRFSILYLTKMRGYSFVVEQLIARLEKEIKVQDKYLKNGFKGS